MASTKLKKNIRERNKARVRAKIFGTSKRPRLSVFRSITAIYAQIIDDANGKTLVSARSAEAGKKLKKTDAAQKVGELLAEKAIKLGITKVVFDRSYYKFHGRVKALAEAARKKGLQF
ncbi:MAG: 50S ribosomal protein L18 [Parcubacteria group bacterium GW2011_GWA2_38_13]|nr:MAG: 50S ribosomal protein L18 [Parcubacteria group bacterium GW2011_GWA2_38_13]